MTTNHVHMTVTWLLGHTHTLSTTFYFTLVRQELSLLFAIAMFVFRSGGTPTRSMTRPLTAYQGSMTRPLTAYQGSMTRPCQPTRGVRQDPASLPGEHDKTLTAYQGSLISSEYELVPTPLATYCIGNIHRPLFLSHS